MTSTEPVGERKNLENETGIVRLIAIIAFSLIIAVLVIVAFFFGFDAGIERLFLLSLPHIILAPLASYASLRLGFLVTVALAFAAGTLVLDVAQWLIRAFAFPFTLIGFIFIIANTAFIVLDALYIWALWRLRTTDIEQNGPEIDTDPEEKHRSIIRQEANTVRLTAGFGLIAVAFLLFFTLIFLGFSNTETRLSLLSILHLPVAPYALFLAPRGKAWMVVMLILGVILLVLDGFELVLRLLSINQGSLLVLTLASIFSITFVLINIGLLMVDLMYILGSSGYLYEKIWTEPVRTERAITTGARVTMDNDDNNMVENYKVKRRRNRKQVE